MPRPQDLTTILRRLECSPARRIARLRFWAGMLGICAASGLLFGLLTANGRPGPGMLYGGCIGAAVLLYEQGVIAPKLRAAVRRLPLAVSVICTEFVYVVMIMVGTAVAGTLLKTTGALRADWPTVLIPSGLGLLYALVVSGTVISLSRMRDLIGAEVFRNLLLGRYHVPVEEERIFLFIDLIGSTAYARRHGDVRAQAFLGAIYAALAEPVGRCRGTVDDYIGDMAMVTWPLAAGAKEARCVVCLFAFLEAILRDAERWRRDFGEVPTFRAALHGGRVVTAEVGIDRHKIAYFGDVVNTTGRLEGLSRQLDSPLLVSSDLLARLPGLPPGVVARDLGSHAVKGHGEPLCVLGLELAARAVAAAA